MRDVNIWLFLAETVYEGRSMEVHTQLQQVCIHTMSPVKGTLSPFHSELFGCSKIATRILLHDKHSLLQDKLSGIMLP